MTTKQFHEGELQLQEQTGMRKKIDVMARHMMRDFMPDEHRDFFTGLEYIFLGTVDKSGLPHAAVLPGPRGFVLSPDPKTLVIQTGDRHGRAAFDALEFGQPVGVLGLDLSNRRRNRMHGYISTLDDRSISITVGQSYGNCPKHITIRQISDSSVLSRPRKIIEGPALDAAEMDIVSTSDTFFIASYIRDGSDAPYEGVDISHRGGPPGFVSVDSPTQLTIPDYRGNYLFNTLGNLLMNPDAGLLFVDFETGDQLHIHGKATMIEDTARVEKFPDAQRLLQIEIAHFQRLAATKGHSAR